MTRFLQKESTQQLFESITILNSGIAELVNSLIQSTNNVSAVLEHSSLPSPPSLPVISDIGPISTLSIPAELSLLRNQKKELEETMQEMEEEAEDLNTTIEQLQRKCAEYETQTNTLAERVRLLEKQIRDNNDLHKNPLLFADNENVKILTEKNTEQIVEEIEANESESESESDSDSHNVDSNLPISSEEFHPVLFV